ncbi:hypothetical protein [Nonomuraea sp. LPB2021202275-12-8]|uniref:hypothetical protein n=1 Tax=Nonomuraea sp. LPB2021202275-12-8 TaxID=3120159 RepID=UPI00300CD5D2
MTEYITLENTALRAQLLAVGAERTAAVAEATTTAAQRDAALRDLETAKALVANYENGITWHTTCNNCATLLDSSYAETVRAERAEARLALVDQAHQPITTERLVPCTVHESYLIVPSGCAMCAKRPTEVCKAGCGDWPCATHEALHVIAVDGEPAAELEDELTLPRALYDKLVLAAEYVAGGCLGPRVSAREALAEIAERS